jgi:hypothetical protein
MAGICANRPLRVAAVDVVLGGERAHTGRLGTGIWVNPSFHSEREMGFAPITSFRARTDFTGVRNGASAFAPVNHTPTAQPD